VGNFLEIDFIITVSVVGCRIYPRIYQEHIVDISYGCKFFPGFYRHFVECNEEIV
jgi:hypothetical protein